MIPSYKIFFFGMLSGGALILAVASFVVHRDVRIPAIALFVCGLVAMWRGLITADRTIDLIYQMRKQITALTAACRSAAVSNGACGTAGGRVNGLATYPVQLQD